MQSKINLSKTNKKIVETNTVYKNARIGLEIWVCELTVVILLLIVIISEGIQRSSADLSINCQLYFAPVSCGPTRSDKLH